VDIAKHVFWERGYGGTAIEDLERSTKLNRSSLYWAFGTKKALFHRALGAYVDGFIGPRLAPMERPDAGLEDIERFFGGLARHFRDDEVAARRGCLMVNSIAEFEGREGQLDGWAAAFRDRLGHAFAKSLGSRAHTGDAHTGDADRRARLLASATLGIWLAARIDPGDAARMCDAWMAQIREWALERAVP
jgi:AcrR family transcriptional regulator